VQHYREQKRETLALGKPRNVRRNAVIKMEKIIILVILISFLLNIINCLQRTEIENYFYKYESDFIEYINSKLENREFNGIKRWLNAYNWDNYDNFVIDFMIGKDYKEAFYKPIIVYIESDNYMDCPDCKGDGELIKKIKKNWFICRREPY
jgi:hypothetical protein